MVWRRVAVLIGVGWLFAPADFGADSGAVRPYLGLRLDRAIYDNPDSNVGELKNPSEAMGGLTFGYNLGPHWGAELAVDFVEADLKIPGLTNRIGEYGTWTIIPQVRYRWPVRNGTIVPYVVGGAGIGIGELNDRDALRSNVPFGGSSDITPVGALGIGVEAFVNRNIALGVEAKHIFGLRTDVSFQGQNHRLNADQTLLSASMRVFLDEPAPSEATMRDARQGNRFYAQLRTGGALLPGADDFSALTIQSPERVYFGFGVGVNLTENWGIEAGGDYWEPELRAPGFGEVGEYALWTVLAHARYRYPLGDGRVVPYALAGGGIGWSQSNDRRLPADVYPLVQETHASVVGSVGAGIEYMFNRSVALGVEGRYLFNFDNSVTIGNTKGRLDNDTLLFLAQIRVFFP
jgi:opacity protein-like surface antigen